MSEFLREIRSLAQAKRIRWKIVACGGRDQAFDKFRNSITGSDASVSVLLVDAEDPLLAADPRKHLKQRDDWDLRFALKSQVQLMVQTMETWIIADSSSLADYYGKGFDRNALPKAGVALELLDRKQISYQLKHSTRRTPNREYKKIRDGRALLAKIDPEVVCEKCPSCKRLFETLKELISLA